MKGLLLKDFYVLGKQLKWFLLVAPFSVTFLGAEFLAVVIALFGILPLTALAYDEQSKWDNLAIMMPYSKKSLVISKYLLGYLGIICAVIIIILLGGVVTLTGLVSIDYSKYKPILLIGASGAFILLALYLIIAFKFGVEKGRYAFMGLMIGIGAGGGFIDEVNNDLYLAIINISATNLFIIAIVLNIVSVLLSIKIKGYK